MLMAKQDMQKHLVPVLQMLLTFLCLTQLQWCVREL